MVPYSTAFTGQNRLLLNRFQIKKKQMKQNGAKYLHTSANLLVSSDNRK